MGHELGAGIAVPLRQDQQERQGRHTGEDVHDGAAREIEHALLEQPAIDVPDPMADRVVDDRRPEHGKQAPGRELHPFRNRADDQGRRDDREHHLEHGEQQFGDAVWRRLDRVARRDDPLVGIRAVDAEFGERLHEHESRIPAEVAVLRQFLPIGPLAGIDRDG